MNQWSSSPSVKSTMSVPCSDPDYRPMKSKDVPLPAGLRAERCWCGHLAKVKESVDFSDKMGMKFFMCANYNSSPTRSGTTSSVCSALFFVRHCVIFVFLLMVLFPLAVSSSHMHVVPLD